MVAGKHLQTTQERSPALGRPAIHLAERVSHGRDAHPRYERITDEDDKPAARKTAPARKGARKAGKTEAAAEVPAAKPEGQALRMDSAALKQDARLVALLRNAVESAAGEDGWSALGSVGQQIGNQASFDPRNYGYRKLIDLIEATQLFELDRRGTQFVLRDKRQGRAAR